MDRDQEFYYFQRCMTEKAEYRETPCEYCGGVLPCDCNNTSFSLFNDAPADPSMAGAPPKERSTEVTKFKKKGDNHE